MSSKQDYAAPSTPVAPEKRSRSLADFWKRLAGPISVRSTPVYRRPSDVILFVLGLLVLAAAALVFLSNRGFLPFTNTLLAAANLLPDSFTQNARQALDYTSFGAVLVGLLLAVLARRWLLVRNLALAAFLVWILTTGVEWAIALSGTPALRAGTIALDVAMVAALATASGAFISGKLQRAVWVLVLLVALAEYFLASFTPLQTLGGLAVGVFLGAAANLALGVPREDISTPAIRQAFEDHHIDLKSIRRVGADARGSVPFFVTSDEGEFFVKLVGAEQRNADFLFKLWRTALLKDPASTAPFLTAIQAIEHEAYLTLLAQKQGVRTPDIEFTARVMGDFALLAQKRVLGRELSDLEEKNLTDDLLLEIWKQVALLHGARIYHGDLRLSNILIDEKNRPWIIDYGFSAAGADDAVLAHDTAQLLASMSYVVGADRTVPIALRALGTDALVAALPNLNPLVLSSATRAELRDDPELLDDVKEAIEQECGVQEKQEEESPFRISRRDLFWVLGLGVGIYALFPQLGELGKIIEAWRNANVFWLLLGLLGSLLTYAIAPFPTRGALEKGISYLQFFVAQFAATFASRFGPQGIGGVYIIERFLEHSGVPKQKAVTAVAVSTGVGPVIHTGLMLLTLALIGIGGVPLIKGIKAWQFGIAALVLLAILIYLWRSDRLASAFKSLRQSIHDMRAVLRNPVKGFELLGGSLGVTLTYIATLYVCMLAVGANVSVLQVAAVYLAGSIIGSASPTPGGLGVLEGAFVAALATFGVPTNQAVAGVLLYRLLTFWLPILPGALAFRQLQAENRI